MESFSSLKSLTNKMNPLRRASAPYPSQMVPYWHADSPMVTVAPPSITPSLNLQTCKKRSLVKLTCHSPPPPLDAESHIPFSAQLFVALQLWNNPEQDHIVRELELQNQKRSRKSLTCPTYQPIPRYSYWRCPPTRS